MQALQTVPHAVALMRRGQQCSQATYRLPFEVGMSVNFAARAQGPQVHCTPEQRLTAEDRLQLPRPLHLCQLSRVPSQDGCWRQGHEVGTQILEVGILLLQGYPLFTDTCFHSLEAGCTACRPDLDSLQ